MIRWFRALCQSCALFPLIWVGYGIEVRGRRNLEQVTEPCLIISNHNMHLDWSMLLRAMPFTFRGKVAIAAAADDIFGSRRRGFTGRLLGNAFPFDKEGSCIRESLEHVNWLLREGANVLMFPEGKLTKCGPTQPFKSGIGWVAVRSEVEVLPMRIDVLRPGIYEHRRLLHPRGRVRVSIGKAVRIAEGTSYADAVSILERAVREA